MARNATAVVTCPVRLSYAHLFEPYAMSEGQTPKYSAMLLIPKSEKATIDRIKAACEAARLASAGTFNGKIPASLKSPLHDGDGEMPNGGEYGPECKGMWVLNASSKRQPGLVDRQCHRIMDDTQLYSGVWALVDINFYAYNVNGNKGIACGLNNLQKHHDDDPLGGGADRAETVFKPIEDDDDDDLGL